jgi:hypothetical protein
MTFEFIRPFSQRLKSTKILPRQVEKCYIFYNNTHAKIEKTYDFRPAISDVGFHYWELRISIYPDLFYVMIHNLWSNFKNTDCTLIRTPQPKINQIRVQRSDKGKVSVLHWLDLLHSECIHKFFKNFNYFSPLLTHHRITRDRCWTSLALTYRSWLKHGDHVMDHDSWYNQITWH